VSDVLAGEKNADGGEGLCRVRGRGRERWGLPEEYGEDLRGFELHKVVLGLKRPAKRRRSVNTGTHDTHFSSGLNGSSGSVSAVRVNSATRSS
jgi:hypothetical protein